MLKQYLSPILFFFLLFSTLHAQEKLFSNIYLYSAKGVDDNLREIPGDIFNLPFEDTYLYALGTFIPHHLSLLDEYPHFKFGSSWIVVKHSGMQSNFEMDIAATLKYQTLFPENAYFNTDLAFGMGVSYAFDTPYYEDPYIEEDGTEKYYRLQCYLHFDAELYTPSIKSLHLLLRLHHRSGVYGLFAPRHVGSNFMGAGLVYYFNSSLK